MSKYWLDHVHIVASDPEKEMDFYLTNFGAKPMGTRLLDDGRKLVELRIGETTLKIYQPTDKGAVARKLGLDHIGLGTDNMDEAVRDLKHRSVKFVWEPRQVLPELKVCFVLTPGEIPIEIMETVR